MGAALSLLLAALLAAPPATQAGAPARGQKRPAPAHRHARGAPPAPQRPPPRQGNRLAEAKAALKALMRDPQKRRYRHRWEKAIRALQAAAVGRDAQQGTLEAARARYALYRWSADEADRDEALKLANRAARLGSKEAKSFAAAVRREAGDDRPAPPPRKPTPGAKLAKPEPPPPPPKPAEETPEPELEAAVADLASPSASLPLGQSAGGGAATVSGVKTWSNDDYTRVAVYLDHWVGWQKLELPARDGAPRRLALDFRPAHLDGAALAKAVAGDQVDRVRAAQHDAETVRVVLDLPGADAIHSYGLDDPPRLIVDVGTRAASREARVASGQREAPPQHEQVEEPPAPEEGGELRPIRRVVVDAGHGGHDPGAIGPSRVREKDVTLAMAKKLAKRLKADGFEVVLTRDDDRYLALEERTAIANTRKGDLFVSIHANANPRRSLDGVETWVLNVADDRYAKRLAARENGADLDESGQGSEAQRILTDLNARASTDASRRLAHLVQREITGSVRGKFGEVRDLGVKSALFYVLVGARMPAVLVETAFISNRREEQRLASPRYQDEVAGAVARAVGEFARRDPRVARASPPEERP
ncbi:MAG TPA: N-acetylmuramoyl-L-alanine amidase [Anaeromyxobacteraceae bacterium]|nr:N-acetylmuramoyl-L-alanine amidase [Anaeromyxobacteraceae bacterium]